MIVICDIFTSGWSLCSNSRLRPCIHHGVDVGLRVYVNRGELSPPHSDINHSCITFCVTCVSCPVQTHTLQVENIKKENISTNSQSRETQGKLDVLEKISGSLAKRTATLEELSADLTKIRKMSKVSPSVLRVSRLRVGRCYACPCVCEVGRHAHGLFALIVRNPFC